MLSTLDEPQWAFLEEKLLDIVGNRENALPAAVPVVPAVSPAPLSRTDGPEEDAAPLSRTDGPEGNSAPQLQTVSPD